MYILAGVITAAAAKPQRSSEVREEEEEKKDVPAGGSRDTMWVGFPGSVSLIPCNLDCNLPAASRNPFHRLIKHRGI